MIKGFWGFGFGFRIEVSGIFLIFLIVIINCVSRGRRFVGGMSRSEGSY